MKNNRKIILGIILIQITLISSCNKFVTVDPPITQLVTSSVFDNDQTALAAMNGIYSFMISNAGFSSGGIQSIGFLSGLSADELTNYSSSSEQIQFYQNEVSKSNSQLYFSFWQSPYQCIYDANSIIEGLTNSTTVSQGLKQELLGEAKFIRAFSNFYLTCLFGDIPLVNTTDYKANAVISRTKRELIYQQIIADLIDSKGLLTKDYSYSNGERVRPNFWAATALLAKVYLFERDWTNAQTEATQVINQGTLFTLVDDLNQVFLKNSSEAIWQLMPNTPGMNTTEGNIYILNSAPIYAALSSQLVNAFEPGDLRKINWIADTSFGSSIYYYPFKYKVQSSETLTEYSMVLRLAEQYLIRAEARANLNNTAGAQSDINIIRNRAGLNNISLSDKDSLLMAVYQERRVELFTEWGNRWLDLIRTGQTTQVLGTLKNNWQPTDTLYPIPEGEIQRDINLSQNAGY